MNAFVWQQLEWRAPAWMLVAMMPLVFHGLTRWRVQQWTRYAEPHLQEWAIRQGAAPRQQTRWVLSIWLFWVLLATAMAGPRLPLDSLDSKQLMRHDMDLMVVLDVSASMNAVDVTPNRLARAKLELQSLLMQLRGERIGLIVYAGEPGLLLPLTHDTAAFQHSLALADGNLFTARGSHLGAALELARRHLSNIQRPRAILLVSDIEASSLSGVAGEAAIESIRALKQAHIPLYAFAMTSQEGGAVPDVQNSPTQQLEPSFSRPDVTSYHALIAAPGGGRVVMVSDDDGDLNALYAHGISQLPAAKTSADKTRRWRELFAYPLALALLLLLFNHLRGMRRGMLALALAGSGAAQAGDASWQEAYRAYHQKQYLLAQQHYRNLNGYHARMGEGAAAYRRKDFTYAARQFTQALLQAHTVGERADALVNLGNSYFYAGNLRAAADAFTGVLRYRAHDARAMENLARVHTSLRQRNAMSPAQYGIPERKGRGLGQAANNAESSRGLEEEKDEARLLGSINIEDAANARATGLLPTKTRVDVYTDRRAALKKLELLSDQRAQTIGQMLKQDASNDIPPDMPPW